MENNNLYLSHHGILGQKWGVRRYQNEDGTLTELGKQRLEAYKKEQSEYVNKSTNRKLKRYTSLLSTPGNSMLEQSYISKIKSDSSMRDKQLKRILNMTYDDMIKEKKYTNAYRIGSTLGFVGAIAPRLIYDPNLMVSIPVGMASVASYLLLENKNKVAMGKRTTDIYREEFGVDK